MRGFDVYLASKAVCHKFYGDLQLLPMPIDRLKNLSMDFVTGLSLSANWKGNSYDSILIIDNHLIKIVHYIPVQVTINILGLVEVIIDMIIRYYGLLDSIISDCKAIFMFKFWSLLCYFLGIKRWFSTTLHSQIDGQTEH